MTIRFCSDKLVDYVNDLGFIFVRLPRDIKPGMMFRMATNGGWEEFDDFLCGKMHEQAGDIGDLSSVRSTSRKLSVVAKALGIPLGSLGFSDDALVRVGLKKPAVIRCLRAEVNTRVSESQARIVDLIMDDWKMTGEVAEYFIVTQVLQAAGLLFFHQSGAVVEVEGGVVPLAGCEPQLKVGIGVEQQRGLEYKSGEARSTFGVKGVTVKESYGAVMVGSAAFSVLGPVDELGDDERAAAGRYRSQLLEVRGR